MSLIVDEHREYLADAVRLSAFGRALACHVTPTSVVADLGTGTGILSLLACRAGAARVYAIDSTGMVEIARALAIANGFADRLHVVKGLAAEAVLPERADIVVADFIGRFGFDAGIFETYPAAVRSILKPGGVLIPAEISLLIFPVEAPGMDARVRFWETPRAGLDVSAVSAWALNTGYPIAFDRTDLLGESVAMVTAQTGVAPGRGFAADVRLPIARAGVLHGLGGGFSARLAPGVTMTNAPGAAERVARRNVFLPVRTPIAVTPGDEVRARLRILPNDSVVSWTVEVADARGGVRLRCAHSTVRGMLIAREDLARARPDFVPSLTPRGVARLTVLELCDGQRPLRDVERLVYERHRQLFAGIEEAAAFVAEVTAGYARP